MTRMAKPIGASNDIGDISHARNRGLEVVLDGRYPSTVIGHSTHSSSWELCRFTFSKQSIRACNLNSNTCCLSIVALSAAFYYF